MVESPAWPGQTKERQSRTEEGAPFLHCSTQLHVLVCPIAIYQRLTALIKAGRFYSAGCGRKSFQLDVRLEDLTRVFQSLGLGERQGYTAGRGAL